MKSLWDQMGQWFSSPVEGSASQPLSQEIWNRSEVESTALEKFRSSGPSRALYATLHDAFGQYLAGDPVHKGFVFLEQASLRGMSLHLGELPAFRPHARTLLNDLCDRFLELQYRKYMSDIRHFRQKQEAVTIYRHYLKPATTWNIEIPADQRYGNVLLECVERKGKPDVFKLLLTPYNDRNYQPALSLPRLMQDLLPVQDSGQ